MQAAALREGAAQAIRQGMQEYPNRAGVQDQVQGHLAHCSGVPCSQENALP